MDSDGKEKGTLPDGPRGTVHNSLWNARTFTAYSLRIPGLLSRTWMRHSDIAGKTLALTVATLLQVLGGRVLLPGISPPIGFRSPLPSPRFKALLSGISLH